MNGCARRLSTCPRITRDMVSQLVPPIATRSSSSPSSGDMPPPMRRRMPSTATASNTTSRIDGSP
jgi:hypothetical protein